MPALQSCPDANAYRRLAAGDTPAPEAEALFEHLEFCDRCPDTIHGLNTIDSLLDSLRDALGAEVSDDSAVSRELIGRLCVLGNTADTDLPHAEGKASETLPSFLDAGESPSTPRPGDVVSGQLGPYRLQRLLGRGGMGMVFLAEDTQLKRPVALKVMKASVAGNADFRRRFLREARATAALTHDHVVTIYQAGEDRGTLYLAMQLLQGESLENRLADEERLPLSGVLRVGREIAEGLAAAHAVGLVHRDVKPANVWLEEPRSRVKLLDFGLAYMTSEAGSLTHSGTVMGTPHYMAPEQASGDPVDGRTDLFSLGCILYRMLTGEVPFGGQNLLQVLHALEMKRPRPVRELAPATPPALAALVDRLLARDPNERPASAGEVVLALERVAAAPSSPPPLPRARRRPPWRMAVAAASLLALIVGGFLLAQIIVKIKGPDGKEKEYAVGKDGGAVIEDDKGNVLGRFGAAAVLPKIPTGQPLSPLALVSRPAKLKGVQSWTVETIGPRGPSHTFPACAYRPDGRQVACYSGDGLIRVWDTGTGELLRILASTQPWAGAQQPLAWSADGKLLASTDFHGMVRVWDPEAGRPLASRQAAGQGNSIAFSPDGKTLAVAGSYLVELLDSRSLERLRSVKCAPRCIAWSPDGKQLAEFDSDETIRVWSADDLELRHEIKPERGPAGDIIPMLQWSPDGSVVALSVGGPLWLFDLAGGKGLKGSIAKQAIKTEGGGVGRCALRWKDGKTLDRIVGGPNNKPTVWDGSGKKLRTSEKEPAHLLAWDADGRHVLQWIDQRLRILDVESDTVRNLAGRSNLKTFGSAAWSRDGNLALHTSSREASLGVSLWNLAETRQTGIIGGIGLGLETELAWSPDGKRLGIDSGVVQLTPRSYIPFQGGYHYVRRYSHDLQWMVSSTENGSGKEVLLLDTRTGKVVQKLPATRVMDMTWSPDGKYLLTVGLEKSWLWEFREKVQTEPFQLVRELPVTGRTTDWSPDGKYVVIENDLYRTSSWEKDHTLGWLPTPAVGGPCRWSPDGKYLARGSQVLEVASNKVVATPGSPFVCWAPDSRHMVLWYLPIIFDVQTNQETCRLLPLADEQYLAVAPEGHVHVSAGAADAIRYVVLTDAGEYRTLTPEEFAREYDWKNDPARVRPTGQ